MRYEVLTAVTMKNAMKFLRSVRRLLVAASVVSSAPTLVTLMKEAPNSSETSVLIRATRRNIPEDTILQSLFLFGDISHLAYPSLPLQLKYYHVNNTISDQNTAG
jgi:hypothetical protein